MKAVNYAYYSKMESSYNDDRGAMLPCEATCRSTC